MSAVTDLSDPLCQALLNTHPNHYHQSPLPLPPQATPLHLIHAYSTASFSPAISQPIRDLITSIRTTQLPRTPISIPSPNVPSMSLHGMSPKKQHEVLRMASYIASLASHFSHAPLHIVDIGAGQGYLTRTLKSLLPSAHIQALDADQAQSIAAQRWEARLLPHADPPIAHRVVFITPQSLLHALDDWTSTTPNGNGNEHPVPVLFVALHACGSLTPAILRAYISASQNPTNHPRWYPAALVAVGCCYNLMDPSDYPEPTKHLPISAYHLAAQIPGTWLLQTDPPILAPSVELAIRKVTWRAMLNSALEHASPISPSSSSLPPPTSVPDNKSATVPARWNRRPPPSTASPSETLVQEKGIGITPHLLRLGKLRDSAYKSWNGFLDAAGERMGVVFREEDYEDEDEDEGKCGEDSKHEDVEKTRRRRGRDASFENALGVLHVLRCLLGPLIESIILRDRVAWVRKGLGLLPSHTSESESESESATTMTTTTTNGNAAAAANHLPDHQTHTPITLEGEIGNPHNDRDRNVGVGSNTRHETATQMRVGLVNLFDQTTGSGRNVAIVIAPEGVENVFLAEGG